MVDKSPLVIHPGKILLEEFIKPLHISQSRLAREIGVPLSTVNDIITGRRGIRADIALRLGRYFSISPQFWMNLQAKYDLELAKSRLGVRLKQEVKTFEEKPFPTTW